MQIIVWACIEDVEEPFTGIAHLQHTSHVSAPIAIIRSTPYSAESVVVKNLEAFLTELVRPEDMRHGVDLQELLHNLRTERVTSPSWTKREFVAFGIRITPNQIRHRPFVWDFSEAIDDLDLVNRMYGRRQAAVDAKDLVVDDDRQRQEVEHVGEVVPNVCIAVLPRTLGVETVRLGNASRLVVATDKVDSVWIAQLQADQKRDCFDREETAVNIIA